MAARKRWASLLPVLIRMPRRKYWSLQMLRAVCSSLTCRVSVSPPVIAGFGATEGAGGSATAEEDFPENQSNSFIGCLLLAEITPPWCTQAHVYRHGFQHTKRINFPYREETVGRGMNPESRGDRRLSE